MAKGKELKTLWVFAVVHPSERSDDMKSDCFSCLCEKEVVNICDGKRLGCVCDLEVDLDGGCVCALLVPAFGNRWNLFCKEQCFRVPWGCIKQIGDDIILIEVTSPENLLIES